MATPLKELFSCTQWGQIVMVQKNKDRPPAGESPWASCRRGCQTHSPPPDPARGSPESPWGLGEIRRGGVALQLVPGALEEATPPQSGSRSRRDSGAPECTEATPPRTPDSCSFFPGSLSFPADSTPGREGLQRTGDT